MLSVGLLFVFAGISQPVVDLLSGRLGGGGVGNPCPFLPHEKTRSSQRTSMNRNLRNEAFADTGCIVGRLLIFGWTRCASRPGDRHAGISGPSRRGGGGRGGGGPEAKDPELLFVRQYRYPVKQVTLELPAGKLDPGESLVVCVKRELEEETGFRASRIRKMLSFWPTPAFANEVIHLYEARDLTPGKFSPDADEFIEPVRLSLSTRFGSWSDRGRIKDSKTLIGLFAFERRLRLG
jgi:8-oxo-dGTP pyrophosphatase MutT (NUDIX family)